MLLRRVPSTELDGSPLVVVGAGVAGWVAARRAQELGIAVTILEKGDAPSGFGNARFSGGYFHAAYLEPWTPPDCLYDTVIAATDNSARTEVVRAWADTVERAYRFLVTEGGEFRPLREDALPHEHCVLQPLKYHTVVGRDWVGGGPDQLLRMMHSRFVESGGSFCPTTRARELLRDEGGWVVGVVVETARGSEVLNASGVVLADGGFQANPRLVGRYITSYYQFRGGAGDTRDALE